jgi:hypothetical protein
MKKRFENDEMQSWYERIVKVLMISDPAYEGLSEVEADEKYYNSRNTSE